MFKVYECIVDPRELLQRNIFEIVSFKAKGIVEFDEELKVFKCCKGWRLEEVSDTPLLGKSFHKYRFIEDMEK